MAEVEVREPTFLVLASLAAGPMHGYALIGEAAVLSEGRVRLKVGTLYAALDRLADQGLIRRADQQVVDGRARQYFELTDAGAALLERAAQQRESEAAFARARLRVRRSITRGVGA